MFNWNSFNAIVIKEKSITRELLTVEFLLRNTSIVERIEKILDSLGVEASGVLRNKRISKQ